MIKDNLVVKSRLANLVAFWLIKSKVNQFSFGNSVFSTPGKSVWMVTGCPSSKLYFLAMWVVMQSWIRLIKLKACFYCAENTENPILSDSLELDAGSNVITVELVQPGCMPFKEAETLPNLHRSYLVF